MPHKDTVTGCMVMTTPEFLNAEAERENKLNGTDKTGSDIMVDIYESMDEAAQNEEKHLQDHPDEILKSLQTFCGYEVKEWWAWEYGQYGRKYHKDCSTPNFRPLYPVAILEVLRVEVQEGLRKNSMVAKVKVRCDNGLEGICVYSYQHWDGSMMEPPEIDEDVDWKLTPVKPSKHLGCRHR